MRLIECYIPLFRFVCEFTQRPESYPLYEDFRAQAKVLFAQAKADSQQLSLSAQDCDDALFAVSVWFDEKVLRSELPHVITWRSELLQTDYFETVIGGELFFNKLNLLSPENTEVKYIYLFCLLLGFQGKYHQQESDERTELINRERHQLPEPWQDWPNDADITPCHRVHHGVGQRFLSRIFNSWRVGVIIILTQYALLGFSLLTLF